MKKRFRFRDDERGATAVEFALVGPLFLLVIFGVMQVSIWVLAGVSLQHAAEMAARCAAVKSSKCSCSATTGCTVADIQTFAAAQAAGVTVPASSFTVSGLVTKDACGGVKVTGPFTPMSFTAGLGLRTYTANASACYPT